MPYNRTKFQALRRRALKLTKQSTITRQINRVRLNSQFTNHHNRAILKHGQYILRNNNDNSRRLTLHNTRLNINNLHPTFRRLHTKFGNILSIIISLSFSNHIVRPKLMNILPPFSNSTPFTRLTLSNNRFKLPQLSITILTTNRRSLPTIRTKINTNRQRALRLLTTIITRGNNNASFNTTFSRSLHNSLRQFTRLSANKRATKFLIQHRIRSNSTSRLQQICSKGKLYKSLAINSNNHDNNFYHSKNTEHLNHHTLTQQNNA